jgi:hypothetical protein
MGEKASQKKDDRARTVRKILRGGRVGVGAVKTKKTSGRERERKNENKACICQEPTGIGTQKAQIDKEKRIERRKKIVFTMAVRSKKRSIYYDKVRKDRRGVIYYLVRELLVKTGGFRTTAL